MTKCAKLKITGRVQGVFFRANCKEQADALNVYGYVKNMSDGSVEAFIQGEDQNLNSLIEWCKNGSAPAKVENVEVIWQSPSNVHERFETI